MRISPAITLVASIAIGITALIAARGWLKPSQADATAIAVEEPAEPETRSVVVARRAIPRGAAIDVDRLEIEEWPIESIPEDSFASFEEVGSTAFAARRALLPIAPGQAIVDTALTDAGVRPTLAARCSDAPASCRRARRSTRPSMRRGPPCCRRPCSCRW